MCLCAMCFRIFLVVTAILAHTVRGQYQASSSQQQGKEGRFIYAAAPLHYVNIGQQLAGDYKFAYDTGKGPMGQSFREEMRLADGSVKGSYGLVDENGHKGIVHYSTGKSNFISDKGPKVSNPSLPDTRRQSNLVTFNPFPQQLQVFKPSNYLQSRTANMEPISEYNSIAPLSYEVPKNKIGEQERKATVPSFYRLPPATTERSIVAEPQNRLPVPAELAKNRLPVPAAVPELQSGKVPPATQSPQQQQLVNIPKIQQMDNISALAEMYKSLKRVTKKPIVMLSRQQKEPKKATRKSEERVYESRTDDDYYDSAPAFIDIGRLSYSVGTDKSSAYLSN